MDQDMELLELTGSISAVIYKNEENGYTVLRLSAEEEEEDVTVVGYIPFAAVGESVIVSGVWTTHNVHGRQFKAEFFQRILPDTETGIYLFLANGAIKGIGPAMASLIVHSFGTRTIEVLENHPEELAKIRGISIGKAKQICLEFHRQTAMRRLMEYICSFGLRPVLAMRIYRYYGDQGLELLRENPYLLASAHIGGSFAEADRLAQEIGMDEADPQRVNAAVLFELSHNLGNGHCFIPREKLAAVTAQLIGVDPALAEEGIERLHSSQQLVYEQIAGCAACYLPELYEAELRSAQRLSSLAQSRCREELNLDVMLESLEKEQKIRYAPLQRRALELAMQHRLVVLTGGPGTGKTTSVRAILALYERLGLKTLLAAPTGRAAKRMSELTGHEAITIHRLLGAKFSEDGEHVVFSKNENEPLECDALILDECSMVDILLMRAVCDALPAAARLVLVGDADQLPSVGPGNVFSAVIRSGIAPMVRLEEIFRQKESSRIVQYAHMINRGEHPRFTENTGGFYCLKRLQAAGSVETICELIAKRLPEKMQIPSEEIQVLSPTRKGELGTVNLNVQLQNTLNPSAPEKREKSYGDHVFREGDRVMQIRNNYDALWQTADHKLSGVGVFNGDIGRILRIDHTMEELTVDFDGRLVSYGFDALMELEHAWAITVHKAQGSEFRAVIMALSPVGQMLMTRDVLYTAVTRAREMLVMVGDEQNAHQMIDNSRQSKRYTALRIRLRKLCGAEA